MGDSQRNYPVQIENRHLVHGNFLREFRNRAVTGKPSFEQIQRGAIPIWDNVPELRVISLYLCIHLVPQGSFDRHSRSYEKAVACLSCLRAFIKLELTDILLSVFVSTVATSA